MIIRQYENFDLELTERDNEYRARVLSSPGGEASMSFAVPVQEEDLRQFLFTIGHQRAPGRTAVDLSTLARDFGEQLFSATMTGDVGGALAASEASLDRDVGLRIRLRTAPSGHLADIPWEFLFDKQRDLFLCQSVRTPLVRYFELPRIVQPLRASLPLRVLVLISDPRNLAQLDAEQEWRKLTSALSPLVASGQVLVERLDQPTLPRLRSWLRNNDVHVLHFLGHGVFVEGRGGALFLEDEGRQAVEVPAETIALLLHDHTTLRLVVLNACEGARIGLTDPFAGVAQKLLQHGMPAVIGMQFEITDRAAISFAHEFYSVMADGYPIEMAITEARRAIRMDVNEIEWATPVLYLRSDDGALFVLEPPRLVGQTLVSLPESQIEVATAAPLPGAVSGLVRVAALVAPTLGPTPRLSVVPDGEGGHWATADALVIAGWTSSNDPAENVGIDLVRHAMEASRSQFGDGAATTALLAAAIARRAADEVARGASLMALTRGIDVAARAVVEALRSGARELDSRELLESSMLVVSEDRDVATAIGEAVDRVSRYGSITVEASPSPGIRVELRDGLAIDRGYLSSLFITDDSTREAVLEDAVLLVVDGKLASLQALLPLLNQVVESGHPLMVIAEEVGQEVLATLLANHARGILQSVAVTLPIPGAHRTPLLRDLALWTGARVVSVEGGDSVEDLTLDDLGRASGIRVRPSDSLIAGGGGDRTRIDERIAEIRRQVDLFPDDEELRLRLQRLGGSVAVIVIESGDVRRRQAVGRALTSCITVVQGGLIPGGGTALLAARRALDGLGPLRPDEQVGVEMVAGALSEPAIAIAENARIDPQGFLSALEKAPDRSFDVVRRQVCDPWIDGLVDATEVVCAAVENAARCAMASLAVVAS